MIRFEGENGEVLVSRGGKIKTEPAPLKDITLKSDDTHLYTSNNHRGDFFNSVKTRTQPICNVEVGHRTATICHLSGIAERLGRPVKWDPKAEQIIDDPVAARMMDRPRRGPYALPI